MKGHPAVTDVRHKPNAEATQKSSPDSPAPTKSSESSKPTSKFWKSITSSPDDMETDTDSTSSDDMQSTTSQISTASNRALRPRIPISCSETLLKHLHGRPPKKNFKQIINTPPRSKAMKKHKKQITRMKRY